VWVKLFLDPNGDGFTSKTTAGFIGDDQTDVKFTYSSLIFPMVGNSDLGPGPDCSFTDFVDQSGSCSILFDASGDWLFRMRMGRNALMLKVTVF
jgi:hypothetical protein